MSHPYGQQQHATGPAHHAYTGHNYGPQPWPAGPQPGHGYPPVMPPQPRNGLGLAALICALIAVPCAFIPIAFIVGGPLSIVAVALGIAATARASRGLATNKGTSAFGVLLGIFALLGAINGARLVAAAADELNQLSDKNQLIIACLKYAETTEQIQACGKP